MLKLGGNVGVRTRAQGAIIFCVFVGQMSIFIFSCRVHQKDVGLAWTRAPGQGSGHRGPVAFIPTITELKSDQVLPHF